MKWWIAFMKKEWLESVRTGKLLFLSLLFAVFGIMNPAVAKLTPWLFEAFAEDLSGSGILITEITVDALASFTQFFKNLPIALIAFVFLYGGTLTKECETGVLIPLLTRGLPRHTVVIAKATALLALFTGGYLLCFGITYGYTAYFWDISILHALFPAVFGFWLFGCFLIAALILFSVIAKSYSGVLLLTGGTVVFSYLISLFPKLTKYLPTALLGTANLLTGAVTPDYYTGAFLVTGILALAMLVAAVPIFNKKQL